MDRNLKRAIYLAGGVPTLARKLNITPQAIRQWDRCPLRQAVMVERATRGQVSRWDLVRWNLGPLPKTVVDTKKA
jgi:DNA-binding transcriptional regulator YdaS (Cro superfamily)